ncbi:unnamed protein product, partial [Musa textilis]
YIWKSEGLRGLFRGNGTNCARIVPNSAVKFFSYEQASRKLADACLSLRSFFVFRFHKFCHDHWISIGR